MNGTGWGHTTDSVVSDLVHALLHHRALLIELGRYHHMVLAESLMPATFDWSPSRHGWPESFHGEPRLVDADANTLRLLPFDTADFGRPTSESLPLHLRSPISARLFGAMGGVDLRRMRGLLLPYVFAPHPNLAVKDDSIRQGLRIRHRPTYRHKA